MKRLALLLASAALAFAAAANAKGPTSATIEGPGLDKPIVLRGDSESANATASAFYRFVQDVGFFAKVFCCPQPNPLLPGRPKGELGPKYTIGYVIPGPENDTYRLTEDLYPYASGGPVSYMRPGLSIFRTMRTHGGWMRGTPALKAALVSRGLSADAPSSSGLSGGAWAGIGVGGLIAILGGTFAARRRLR